MDQFKALRRLAVTLGVAAPESSDDLFNASFINSLNRAAKRVQGKRINQAWLPPEEIFHHILKGNGGHVTKPSEIEVFNAEAIRHSIEEGNNHVVEYLHSHGMGFLQQQIGRAIRPHKVKGYIFQLKDGSYYRDVFCGTTDRRCDAYVYTMKAILINMADHDVDSWGVTWKGKWKVVYNKGNEV